MDWTVLGRINGATFIDGLTDNVDDSSERLGADWDHNRVASVCDALATNKTFSGVQRNGSHVVATQMLGNFQNQTVSGSLHFERVENGR